MSEKSTYQLITEIATTTAFQLRHKLQRNKVIKVATRAQEEAGFHTVNAIVISQVEQHAQIQRRGRDALNQLSQKSLIGPIARRFQPKSNP